jgi:hypothetical protein
MFAFLAALFVSARLELPVPAVHPMHTSVTQISYDAGSCTAAILIRMFADDVAAAVGSDREVPADSAISRYVRASFTMVDRSGRSLPIQWLGAERVGDVVLLRLSAKAPQGFAQVKVLNALLADHFADQVNIVRASYDGRAATLLFTRGDPAKALP